MNFVRTEVKGAVAWVTLNRPATRNAFDEAMILEITTAFTLPPAEARVIVLAAEGPAFCAGGDVDWMKRSKAFTPEENRKDAQALAQMLRAVEECPVPVVARVHGTAIGGGAGLIAACDVAVCAEDTKFGFPEVRLGLIPAVISLVVIPRIGLSEARRYFLTGERFGAVKARAMGLVHDLVPPAQLDARVEAVVAELLRGAPKAMAEAKKLLRTLPGLSREEAQAWTVEAISAIRVAPEAQEGLAAFLEKRPPVWP